MLRNPGWFWMHYEGTMTYFHNPHADGTDYGSIIEGRQMSLGEKVLKTDRYASTDGTWKAPGQSVGITIESTKVVWVRPTPHENPKQPRIAYSAAVTAK